MATTGRRTTSNPLGAAHSPVCGPFLHREVIIMKYHVINGEHQYIMTPEEFKAWVEMFMVDPATGKNFSVERRVRA